MELKKGQIIYINSEKYKVINMINFSEKNWQWQEYEIVNEFNQHKWLEIEEDENKQLEYCLYDYYNAKIDTNLDEIYGNDYTKYKLYEKGTAIVIDYFGNADVDKYESCDYITYISEDQNTVISVENWSGEIETTIGRYISPDKIKITDQIEQNTMYQNTETLLNINNVIRNVTIFLIVLTFLIPFIGLIKGLFVNKSIEKYINKNTSKYTYVTSITNNTNKEKAKVYKSSFISIDETVKDIIDGVPEGITKTSDIDKTTEDDGIGLQTKNEYAYIYKELDGIYVQISTKKYLNNSGTMYHSRHYHNYYRSYTNPISSTVYDNYVYSARQSSINSRTSSGGGTSAGK